MTKSDSSCRSCGSVQLSPVLDLGNQPLANRLVNDLSEPDEPFYPLDLVFCPRCSLVQITETVPPEILFADYAYLSSFSDTMLRHAADIAARMSKEEALDTDKLVVELASNDGYLLKFYQDLGVKVLGVDPAKNVVEIAEQKGIPTRCAFFNEEVGRSLAAEGIRADVMHANNVLAHVADLHGFIEGIRIVLAPQGVAVIEAPYVRKLIENVEFDTIYHEHLCYFSLTALISLLGRHGLRVQDVERLEIHGGSLRVFVVHEKSARPEGGSVAQMLAEEKAIGIPSIAFYRNFAERVRALREKTRTALAELKEKGAKIAAYGASAKGSTLLNYYGIGRETLDFVADRSTLKQGKLTPGTHLPILPPEILLERMPDYLLLLTWNFKEEILAQQKPYRERGGRFIIPVPDVAVV